MRRAFAAACVVIVALAPAFADDDAKVADDKKAIESWLEQQKPRNASERKALRVELEKKLRAFLKDHPSAGVPTFQVKAALADVVLQDSKFDESIALYEELVKCGDDATEQRARYGLVKALITKRDMKTARTRLDELMKAHPDDKNLGKLDEYLRQIEVSKSIKVGKPAPSFKQLDELKGKIVLLEFWTSVSAEGHPSPCMKELPMLKKLHAELAPKGLQVLGVAFDADEAAFKKFVEKEQLDWPEVTGKEAQTVTRELGVKQIPCGILVGKDGKILALNLRGAALEKAVRAAVSGKPLVKPDDDR